MSDSTEHIDERAIPDPPSEPDSDELLVPARRRQTAVVQLLLGVFIGLVLGYVIWSGDSGATTGNDSQSSEAGATGTEQLFAEGVDLQSRGDLDGAASRYEAVLELEPTNQLALYNLALTRQIQEQFDEAIVLYVRAIEVAPEFLGARFNLAVAYRDAGDATNAVAQFRAILDLKPDDANTMYNLGLVLNADGPTTEGDELLARARAIDPSLDGGG